MAELKLKLRISYVNVHAPDSYQDDKPMFSLKGIVVPNSPEEKLLDKTILEVATAKWGAKAAGILAKIKDDNQKIFFIKKEYTNEAGDVNAGFEDMYYLTAKNSVKPGIFDADRTPLTAQDGKPYSGCWAVVKIDVYAQVHPKGGNGVRATLLGVQFWKDGDAFAGGRAASAEDFDDLSDTGEDDDSDLA
jgi:hypothetical protein